MRVHRALMDLHKLDDKTNTSEESPTDQPMGTMANLHSYIDHVHPKYPQ